MKPGCGMCGPTTLIRSHKRYGIGGVLNFSPDWWLRHFPRRCPSWWAAFNLAPQRLTHSPGTAGVGVRTAFVGTMAKKPLLRLGLTKPGTALWRSDLELSSSKGNSVNNGRRYS